MNAAAVKYKSVDEYIASFPENTARLLEEMRAIVTKAAPQSTELISYNMPAIKQHGVLVYYAAYKHHIGFYPTSSGIRVFEHELKNYKTSKGAIQFPIDKPIPKVLVKKIVTFRVKEDAEKAVVKKRR